MFACAFHACFLVFNRNLEGVFGETKARGSRADTLPAPSFLQSHQSQNHEHLEATGLVREQKSSLAAALTLLVHHVRCFFESLLCTPVELCCMHTSPGVPLPFPNGTVLVPSVRSSPVLSVSSLSAR